MEENLVEETIQRSHLSEVLIVGLRASGGVDADVVAFPEHLQNCLSEYVLMLDRRELLEHVNVLRELPIVLQPLDCLDRLHIRGLGVVECDSTLAVAAIASDTSRHKRVESTAELIVQILQVPQWIEDAIVAICLTHGLASILIAFHPILGLIRTFSFPVVLPDADEVERVGQELSFYLHIELTVAGQARRQVYLD